MSVQSQKTTTTSTYRTMNVASPEPVSSNAVLTTTGTARSASPLQYAVNGGNYSTLRYLVPVQPTVQQQSYVLVQQPAVMQQMMSPVYLQGVPRVSVSSLDSELLFQQNTSLSRNSSSGLSLSSSPPKTPEPSLEEEEEEEEEDEEAVEVEEVEIVNVIQQKPPPPAIEKISRTEVKTDLSEATKMDTRYFAALLADVYRKNCDIHSCISEHVSKIRGQTVDLGVDQVEDVEAMLPKGATELTKQQIRYLLQTRLTADKSMRLLLSTFSSLREELLHMSEDLRRLESEKEALERDLAFKVDQARQYDSLLEEVRENNRQLQVSLKETTSSQRALESQLMSARNVDSSRDFRMRELEGRIRALEKENEILRQKQLGQSNSSTLHIKTEELSRQFNEQLSIMKQEKEQEIQRLRTQITRLQTEITTERTSSASEKTLQLKISELLAMLEQRQTTITRQEEEIRKLMMDRTKNDNSRTTKTIITKRYRTQYPILGLLGDDYQGTTSSPIGEDKTVVIERTGEVFQRTSETYQQETGIAVRMAKKLQLSSLDHLLQLQQFQWCYTRHPSDQVVYSADKLMFVDMLKGMFRLDASLRMTPRQVLEHQFIRMSHLWPHFAINPHVRFCCGIMAACDSKEPHGKKKEVFPQNLGSRVCNKKQSGQKEKTKDGGEAGQGITHPKKRKNDAGCQPRKNSCMADHLYVRRLADSVQPIQTRAKVSKNARQHLDIHSGI